MTAKNRPSKHNDTVQVSTRLPVEAVEIVDRYVEYFNTDKPFLKKTRGDVLREMLQVGLEQYQTIHPLDGGTKA